MRVFLSEEIEADLDAIADYIAADNPRRALTFLSEITASFARIGENPQHFQLRPEIAADARLAVVRQ